MANGTYSGFRELYVEGKDLISSIGAGSGARPANSVKQRMINMRVQKPYSESESGG